MAHSRLACVAFVLAVIYFSPASANAASVVLSWTDRSTNEQGFRIERQVSGGNFVPIATVGANVQLYVDSSVRAGVTYCYAVKAFNSSGLSAASNAACSTVSASRRPVMDFDSDRRADLGVYRDGTWYLAASTAGVLNRVVWGGAAQDIPVPADYDGDGRADVAIYRSGVWYIVRSSDGIQTSVAWGGAAQDIPVPADYDGDGRADAAVYRSGMWYIAGSTAGVLNNVAWGGAAQDKPVPADYDGDGRADAAI
jgi:hypothetical protein